MKIGLRYGHSVNCKGASGIIDEVDSCRILYYKIKDLLEAQDHIIIDCNSNAYTESAELAEGTNKANANNVDIYITLHLNSSSNSNAKGVECWTYNSSNSLAISIGNRICNNITGLGTSNRGMKYNTGYHDLSASNMESIIVEVLFCNNQDDVNLFKAKTDQLAAAIANGIDSEVSSNVSTKENSNSSSTPVDPPVKESVDVTCQVYSNGRWLPNVVNLEDYAGIYGESISGIFANTNKGYIKYRVHINNRWLPWVIDRQDYAGILDTNIDGLQMQLVDLPGYSVKYRTYVGGRWLPWVLDLEDYAGIYGQSIEGIQMQIIKR
jgi:hypothetical protein